MSTSFTITRVGGIPIRVNISLVVFLPILAWLIASGGQIQVFAGPIGALTGTQLNTTALLQGSTPLLIGVLAGVGLFASVTVHELGHSFVARRYGIVIQSITLWIFGGIANMETIPKEWDRELLIAIAGPITSLLIATACLLTAQVLPASVPALVFVVGWLGLTNIVLAAFNLLPAFPMDGGRVFRALLTTRTSYTQATHTAARVGELFALLFAIVGVLSFNLILVLVALFVYGAAISEYRTVAMTELFEGWTAEDVMSTDLPTVTAGTPVSELTEQMIHERQSQFVVVDDGELGQTGQHVDADHGHDQELRVDETAGTTESLAGVVSLSDLRRRGPGPDVPVGAVMRRDLDSVSVDEPAIDVLMQLLGSRADCVFVERDSQPVGVIRQRDLIETANLLKQRGHV